MKLSGLRRPASTTAPPSRALFRSAALVGVTLSTVLALSVQAAQASAGAPPTRATGAPGGQAAVHTPAQRDLAHWPSARSKAFPGFDDQASQFQFFYDCQPAEHPCPGHALATDVPSPSEDGDALDINYESGNPSYMGADAYIRLGADDAATRYQVNYDFYVPDLAPVQALEFCMNNYIQNKRYQWAMQWEHIGTGAPQWRLWAGTGGWMPIGIPDSSISPNTWYTLTIDGDIVQTAQGPQVHYMDFIIHGVSHDLSKYMFPPTSESGDGLVAAVQVDGDAHADPYQTYIDNAHFYWK